SDGLRNGDGLLHKFWRHCAPHRTRTSSRTVARHEPISAHCPKDGPLVGVHAVHSRDVSSFEEMVEKGKRMALRHQIAKGGERIVLMAGIPFGTAGSTNVLHVVRLIGDELERYSAGQ